MIDIAALNSGAHPLGPLGGNRLIVLEILQQRLGALAQLGKCLGGGDITAEMLLLCLPITKDGLFHRGIALVRLEAPQRGE